MKKRWFILTIFILLGVLIMPMKALLQSSLDSTTNYATRFLRVRPESTRPQDLTLTMGQLLAFKDHVFIRVDDTIDNLHDVNREAIMQLKPLIEIDLTGLNQSEFDRNFDFYYGLYEDLFTLYSYTLESRWVEGRGVWHRPFESDLNAVRQTLEDLQAVGINMLFVETFWMGRLIYMSDIPGTHQHAFTFNGYRDESVDYGTNLLVAFIEEAKAYDIEVHAWVENFFVGFGTNINGSPILQSNPQWSLYNHDGSIPQKFETNYLFMDPANPEVREYLKQIYVEIAGFQGVASIHLDYIRYPVNMNPRSATNNGDTGYSAIAEREFKHRYGYTGDLRNMVIENAQVARDWQDYKTQNISSFVAGVHYRIKTTYPDVYLSTAIFGNVDNAIRTKNQDWQSWIDQGYIEIILPMAYYQSSLTVRNEARTLNDKLGYNAFSYVGIAPSYMGYNDHLNTVQINASQDARSQGVTFFATQSYLIQHFNGRTPENMRVQDILRQGVFRNDAILPHQDISNVLNVSLDEMLSRSERIYVPHGAMTPSQKNQLESVFMDWRNLTLDTNDDVGNLINTIEAFKISDVASGSAVNRLQETMNYLLMILNIHFTRGQWEETIDLSVDPDQKLELPPLNPLDAPLNLRIEAYKVLWDASPLVQNFMLYINGESFQITEASFDLRTINLFEGPLRFTVKALGDNIYTADSDLSEDLEYQTERISPPQNLRIINDVLFFDPVENAEGYRIRIGGQTFLTELNQFSLVGLDLPAQALSITVTSLGNNYQTLNSSPSISIRYTVKAERLQIVFKSLFFDFAKLIVASGE